MFEGLRESRQHNRHLKDALAGVERAANAARSDTDLVAAVRTLEPFGSPVKFDPRFANGVALLCLLPAIAAAGWALYASNEPVLIVAGAGAAIVILVWAITRFSAGHSLSRLSDAIHYKSTLFDYGLEAERFDPEGEARRLGQQFGAFRHGNHRREMKSILRGNFAGAEHDFAYRLYHFHYVNKRIETYTTTDSKGRVQVRTRTVYDHFDRYGILTPFGFTHGICISETMLGFFTSSWKTASSSFNKKFSVRADSDMTAAKFLVPKVILEIEAAGEALGGMELEINSAGDLCLSFADADMIRTGRRHGLETPAEFADEIGGKQAQPKLDAALRFIHTLMKYSDNNFDTQPNTAERKSGPWSQ